jgi:hypothetical protein
MPFGFGKHEQDDVQTASDGATANALVTATEEPLDNAGGVSSRTLALTQVLVSLPSGAVVGVRGLPLDPEHWLVAGMTVPVSIDPANPNSFEVDWARVPSIQDRVAANDPSLLDPMAARLKSWDALAAAGFHEPDLDQVAPQLMTLEMNAMRARLAAEPDAFARQLSGVEGQNAPEGQRRALVQIAASTATWEGTRFGENQHRDVHGKHAVVLSVSVPGDAPYAVFVKTFDHQHRAYDENNPGLPALVSLDDPGSVQVLWDEMPTTQDQETLAKQQSVGFTQSLGAIEQEHAAALAAASASTAAPPVAGMPLAANAAAIANAKRALDMVPPAARPGMIAYYRSMGVNLDS